MGGVVEGFGEAPVVGVAGHVAFFPHIHIMPEVCLGAPFPGESQDHGHCTETAEVYHTMPYRTHTHTHTPPLPPPPGRLFRKKPDESFKLTRKKLTSTTKIRLLCVGCLHGTHKWAILFEARKKRKRSIRCVCFGGVWCTPSRITKGSRIGKKMHEGQSV